MTLRKGYFFLITLLLLKSQYLPGQDRLANFSAMARDTILMDQFDNNKNRWITENEYVSGRFENSHLILKCKNFKGSGGMSYIKPSLDINKDFEILATFNILKGAGSIVFGMNKDLDHFRIELNDQIITIVKNSVSKSKIEKLYTGSTSAISKDKPVKMTLLKSNNILYIFVNDSYITQIQNLKFPGNQTGFNVSLNSEISVDYISISYLKPISAPEPEKITSFKKDSINVVNENNIKIFWISPTAEKSIIQEFSAPVKAKVYSRLPLEKVLFYVNGVPSGESLFQPVSGEPEYYSIEKLISFKPGNNIVYFIATNNKQQTNKSDYRYFSNPNSTLPVIRWTSPSSAKSAINRNNVLVESIINSPSGLNSVKILVNGIIYFEDNTPQNASSEGDIRIQRQITLKEGDNTILILASNGAGSSPSEERTIVFDKSIAEKRLALVMGNSEYKNKSPLKNTVNDANLMEVTLKDLGFDVIKCINAGVEQMKDSIRHFNERLPDYNVGLFYYAGHGVQVDGINYLLPTDAKLEDRSACKYEAVRVDFIVEEFEKYPDNTNIVILDACRNNPFASWDRGGENAFKPMNHTSGTIISFATSPGETAEDGKGSNGLFTEELVKQMNIPQPVENVFKKTRIEVKNRSNGKQVPQEWTKLNGDFYFKKTQQ